MSKYQTFGPFEIPTIGSIVNKREFSQFWDDIEQKHAGLSGAVGCYIFAIRAGKGARPWYVGKTEKLNFRMRLGLRTNSTSTVTRLLPGSVVLRYCI